MGLVFGLCFLLAATLGIATAFAYSTLYGALAVALLLVALAARFAAKRHQRGCVAIRDVLATSLLLLLLSAIVASESGLVTLVFHYQTDRQHQINAQLSRTMVFGKAAPLDLKQLHCQQRSATHNAVESAAQRQICQRNGHSAISDGPGLAVAIGVSATRPRCLLPGYKRDRLAYRVTIAFLPSHPVGMPARTQGKLTVDGLLEQNVVGLIGCQAFARALGQQIGETIQHVLSDLAARGRQPSPSVRDPRRQVVQIAAGGSTSCVRYSDGEVACWGDLGLTPGPLLSFSDLGLGPARDLSVGDRHVCLVDQTDQTFCWGDNHLGQLGQGRHLRRTSVRGTLDGVSQVAVGSGITCVRRQNGEVWCWGAGFGDSPQRIDIPAHSVELAVGGRSACSRTTTGRLWCWSESKPPKRIASIDAARTVAVGALHACAVTDSKGETGQVYCWGDNSFRQIAVSRAPRFDSPTAVDVKDAVALSLGTMRSCARTQQGAVICWGWNSHLTRSEGHPEAVALDGVEQIAVGKYHACAKTAASIWCWGYNNVGQLGLGDRTDRPTPAQVTLVASP
ncbi:MAG: hypothetical protein H6707_16755 [Deltaproteobacteria bacterium]|nr:hypothetical protein [Deltaproteobacteria bacterium]